MKKVLSIICMSLILGLLSACTNKNDISNETGTENSKMKTSNILVVSFSCTGNTRSIAKKVAEYLNGDFYEIIPENPYTDEDLKYQDDHCRANKEQADDHARPEITGDRIDVSSYDTIIISFPIWWGKEPRIIDTFMETYDLSGKTLTCFCTSGGSGIDEAESHLKDYVPDGNWLTGIRFSKDVSDEKIKEWLEGIGLNSKEGNKEENEKMTEKMKVTIGNYNFTALLEDNDAVNELIKMMQKAPITIDLDDYSGFEKVGSLGRNLTRSDKQTTTKSSDIVLYNGNQIVVFYGSNAWSYTRIGKIDDLTNWKKALGSGNVTVTFSIEE